MPLCGGLTIGVDSSEPKTPPLVMVNVPPSSSSGFSLSSCGACGEVGDAPARFRRSSTARRRAAPARPAPCRRRRRCRCRNSCDRRCRVSRISALNCGHCLERVDDRLDEERHEAELDAVLFLERLLVLLAQREHRRHVDLVERRQQRGRVLRLDEPLGDGAPQQAHAAQPALHAARRTRLRRRRGRGNFASCQ